MIEDVVSLALNIYFEARGESRVGQLAVGLVTLNRVADDRWPDTIKEVVWQDTKPDEPGGEQFSWTLDYDWEQEALGDVSNPFSFNEALGVAIELLNGDTEDFTEGANLYHALEVSPWWIGMPTVVRTTLIGNHVFYKE